MGYIYIYVYVCSKCGKELYWSETVGCGRCNGVHCSDCATREFEGDINVLIDISDEEDTRYFINSCKKQYVNRNLEYRKRQWFIVVENMPRKPIDIR